MNDCPRTLKNRNANLHELIERNDIVATRVNLCDCSICYVTKLNAQKVDEKKSHNFLFALIAFNIYFATSGNAHSDVVQNYLALRPRMKVFMNKPGNSVPIQKWARTFRT